MFQLRIMLLTTVVLLGQVPDYALSAHQEAFKFEVERGCSLYDRTKHWFRHGGPFPKIHGADWFFDKDVVKQYEHFLLDEDVEDLTHAVEHSTYFGMFFHDILKAVSRSPAEFDREDFITGLIDQVFDPETYDPQTEKGRKAIDRHSTYHTIMLTMAGVMDIGVEPIIEYFEDHLDDLAEPRLFIKYIRQKVAERIPQSEFGKTMFLEILEKIDQSASQGQFFGEWLQALYPSGFPPGYLIEEKYINETDVPGLIKNRRWDGRYIKWGIKGRRVVIIEMKSNLKTKLGSQSDLDQLRDHKRAIGHTVRGERFKVGAVKYFFVDREQYERNIQWIDDNDPEQDIAVSYLDPWGEEVEARKFKLK